VPLWARFRVDNRSLEAGDETAASAETIAVEEGTAKLAAVSNELDAADIQPGTIPRR
jgi:hypothetical protein